jgi:uncharacterized membrane protein YkoI
MLIDNLNAKEYQMKRMSIYILAIMLLSVSAFAAKNKVADKNDYPLQKLANVSPDSAKALAHQKAPGKIVEGDLEVENGILIYSYDIQAKDNKITEVQINAKDASVVSVKEETLANEKAEKKESKIGKEEEEKGEKAKMEAGEEKEGKEGKESEEKAEKAAKKGEWVASVPVKADTNLATLAKINIEQADAAALKLVEGTIKKTELANKDGYLVYKVAVDVSGTNYEVLVDAGNAKVLEIETEE